MDVESRSRWEQYTKAKEAMLEHTHIRESVPWHLVEAVDKKKARLNCIAHSARKNTSTRQTQFDRVVLPARIRHPEYQPRSNSARNVVPERY